MEKIAITQEEIRGHVGKDKADSLYIVLSLIASVDFIRRLLLISVTLIYIPHRIGNMAAVLMNSTANERVRGREE